MKRGFRLFVCAAVWLVLLVACAGTESSEPATTLQGPALVMFYTDN